MIQAVDRALRLLELVAASDSALTGAELASAAGVNRSTAWRLLGTLEAHDLVERDPQTNRYGLGMGTLQLAARAPAGAIVRRARPILERLARDAGEAATLTVGGASSLHDASSSFPTELASTGIGTSFSEYEPGLNGISAAARDASGEPVAYVSLTGPDYRLPERRADEVAPLLLGAAAELEAVLLARVTRPPRRRSATPASGAGSTTSPPAEPSLESPAVPP